MAKFVHSKKLPLTLLSIFMVVLLSCGAVFANQAKDEGSSIESVGASGAMNQGNPFENGALFQNGYYNRQELNIKTVAASVVEIGYAAPPSWGYPEWLKNMPSSEGFTGWGQSDFAIVWGECDFRGINVGTLPSRSHCVQSTSTTTTPGIIRDVHWILNDWTENNGFYTLNFIGISDAPGTDQATATITKLTVTWENYGAISINKRSKVPELTENKDNYSLAGAQYGVYTDSACTQRAKDANGNDSGIVTDEDGYGEAQNLKVGTYWVKELVSSPNYQLDTTVHKVTTEAGATKSAGISSEPYNYGYIDLQKKSANESITNGNSCYSLEGAVYGIYGDKSCNNKVMQITTNRNGYATTKGAKEGDVSIEDRITLSTYYIKEITAPKGFALDNSVYTVTFDYKDGDKKHRYVNEKGEGTQPVEWQTKEKSVVYDTPQSDPIGLLLGKADNETSNNSPLAGATLEGAEFRVTYYDVEGYDNKNCVDSTQINEISAKAKSSRSWVFTTDEDGFIYLDDKWKISSETLFKNSTAYPCMPIGTVVIEEINPPQGYLNSNAGKYWIRSVTKEGNVENIHTYNPPDGETAFKEQVIRGDLAFTKANAQTQQRLAGVPFVIKSKTTGEWHVAVTDENGQYSTESKFAPHTSNTNKNDEAITQNADGTYTVDTSKLECCEENLTLKERILEITGEKYDRI